MAQGGSSTATGLSESADTVARLAGMLASAAAMSAVEDSVTDGDSGVPPTLLPGVAVAGLPATALQQQQQQQYGAGWLQGAQPTPGLAQLPPIIAGSVPGSYGQQLAQPQAMQLVGGQTWPQMPMPLGNGQQQQQQLHPLLQQQLQQIWPQQQQQQGSNVQHAVMPAALQLPGMPLPQGSQAGNAMPVQFGGLSQLPGMPAASLPPMPGVSPAFMAQYSQMLQAQQQLAAAGSGQKQGQPSAQTNGTR